MAPSVQPSSSPLRTSKGDDKYANVKWEELGFSLIPTDCMYVAKCRQGESFTEGKIVPYGDISISPCSPILNYGQVLFSLITCPDLKTKNGKSHYNKSSFVEKIQIIRREKTGTAWFVWQDSSYQLLLLQDRENRVIKPAAWWDRDEETKDILGGRDEKTGGTWLGCSKQGRVAFLVNVTNQTSFTHTGAELLTVKFLKEVDEMIDPIGPGRYFITSAGLYDISSSQGPKGECIGTTSIEVKRGTSNIGFNEYYWENDEFKEHKFHFDME
ncbi:hypothetical protein Bca101_076545 [Brassica carinata]